MFWRKVALAYTRRCLRKALRFNDTGRKILFDSHLFLSDTPGAVLRVVEAEERGNGRSPLQEIFFLTNVR